MAVPTQQCAYLFPGLAETELWGQTLGARLAPGDVIALIGDLGAGKTTLTQALAKGMNIPDRVTSPTFALAQEYPGRVPLFHFDPYRLDSTEAFAEIGFDEYFERGGVIVVEWADKITALLPHEILTLRLALMDELDSESEEEEAPRLLQAEAVGKRYVNLLTDLNAKADIAALVRFPG